MAEKSIALLPPNGFGETQSGVALAWLSWMKQELGLEELRHARNSVEVRIAGFKLDGVGWCGPRVPGKRRQEMHVLEFHGCYHHRHPEQFCSLPNHKGEGFKLDNFQYQQTLEKIKHLSWLSNQEESPYGPFKLHVIWECELYREMAKNPRLNSYIKAFKRGLSKERVSPRLALFGGKTVPFQHDVTCSAAEEIRYEDFKSLYPAVCACVNEEDEEQAYPVGHPEVFLSTEVADRWPGGVERALQENELFGLLRVRLQPPRRLLHPIIPMRTAGGKLLFPLCRSCGEQGEQKECQHAERERALEGTFTSLEVKEALRLGYRVKQTWEVWHYPERRADLLRRFIFSLFLDKEYCSGWPPSRTSPEARQEYTEQLSRWCGGLQVDPDRFKKNPAGRQLAKLILNSCWGYFAKREDMVTKEMLIGGECTRLLAIDADPKKELVSAQIVGKGLLVCWKPKEERIGKKSAAVLGVFTTAMARLRLNRVLERLGAQALYCDTDSVMYICPRGSWRRLELPRGDWMGELQDELEAGWPGRNARGVDFISLGPKTYSLRVVAGESGEHLGDIVRYKGVIMTSAASGQLTLEGMRQLVVRRGEGATEQVQQLFFRKKMEERRVQTMMILKGCRFTSNKRRFLPSSPRLETLPYGFIGL